MLTMIFQSAARIVWLVCRISLGLRLLARIRRRDGLKWGMPAMLIAAPYLLVASTCMQIIKDGGPEWLYLVVYWCINLGIAFLLIGPLSVLILIKARISEAVQRRRAVRSNSYACDHAASLC